MNKYEVNVRGEEIEVRAAICTFEGQFVVFKDTKGQIIEAYPSSRVLKVSKL